MAMKWQTVIVRKKKTNLPLVLGCVLEFKVGHKIFHALLVGIFLWFSLVRMLGLTTY